MHDPVEPLPEYDVLGQKTLLMSLGRLRRKQKPSDTLVITYKQCR